MPSPRLLTTRPFTRRTMLGAAVLGGGLALAGRNRLALARPAVQGTPVVPSGSLTIDLASEPATLDPANVYDADGWSVIHSVYDALVQYGPDGRLEPLLAESLTALDPLTYEIALREGVRFHNGEPFDARAVTVSVAHLVDPETASQVGGLFKVIERVEEVDPLLVRLHLSAPAPWLPAQMAAWLVMLPPDYATDPATDLAAKPVGTGPYRLDGWDRGSEIRLTANPDYAGAEIKGAPVAAAVTYRFVPEASTRVADLLGGGANLVRAVPVDQVASVRRGGATVTEQAISGSAWVRIPTDVAPFDDPRVRRALNHAVDVDTIVAALLGGTGRRLANFFPEGGLGFDPDLAPIAYDPDLARALLAEAGHPDGFETRLAYASSERGDVVTAVAGFLNAVGVRTVLERVETATFNSQWTDPEAAPLRFATWRPLFDPYTLLNLIVSNQGFLSRHDNASVQTLIDAAATEADEETRSETYRTLGQVLRDEPAAIYLYSLTARYGVAAGAPAWTPRPDDYLIATKRG